MDNNLADSSMRVRFAAAMRHSWRVLSEGTEAGLKMSFDVFGADFAKAVERECQQMGQEDTDAAEAALDRYADQIAEFVNTLTNNAACEIMTQAAKRNRGNN